MRTQHLPSRNQITRVKERIFRRWTPMERARRAEQARELQAALFHELLAQSGFGTRQTVSVFSR